MTRGESAIVQGAHLTRRGLLGAGGALVAGIALGADLAAAQRADSDPGRFQAWLEIHADNSVLIRTGKCDFGQSSIYTAYRQIVAEELCVPLDAVTSVISGDTDRTPEGGGTFGLMRAAHNHRKVAAYVREAALDLAARKFGVARATVNVKDGIISSGGASTSYGALIAGQELTLTIPVGGDPLSPLGLSVKGDPPLKPASQYAIVGKSVPNSSLRPKMSGKTIWVGDVKLPGMLHGRTVHPDTLGSTLITAGKIDAKQFPNSRVVVIGNLVAVVSPDEWEAIQAAQQVAADTRWNEWRGLPGDEKLHAFLRKSIDWTAFPARDGPANKGDVTATQTGKVLDAGYDMPFQKHAPIAPMVSTADVKPDGSVVLHTLSQNPQHLRRMIAKMLGVIEVKVVVRTYPGSGHYGRSNGGSAGSEDEAVLLSREVGRPVRVQWMRPQDMQWSTQSSASISDIRIVLGADGRIASYQAHHRAPAMRDDRLVGALLAGLPTVDAPSAETTYGLQNGLVHIKDAWAYARFPNVEERGFATFPLGQRTSPTSVGLRGHSMRTPTQFQQNCPREMAISEAAALAGKDALQFRLDHVQDPRFAAVLERLRVEARWDSRPSPAPTARATGETATRGRGASMMLRDNGYWACAAHVAVIPDSGEVKVERLTIICDVGLVVNPRQLERQIQGGCLMGVSQALYEEVTFDDGGVTVADWGSYPILRMADIPDLKIVIASAPGITEIGQGSEGANAFVASAVAGAFFDATGKAIRRIPLRPDHVKAALAA